MRESKELPPIPLHFEAIETDSKTETGEHETIISQPAKSSWKHLFTFTTWSHAGPLATALVASGAAAGLKTVLAVVLGEVFSVIGDYGVGKSSSSSTLSSISKWSTILVGLGLSNWIANSAFLALWIAFGELQAKSIRHDTFDSLLSKDMAWFDSQEQGVSSLLVRIQTQTRELQLATSQVLGLLVCDTLTALASLGVAFYYSWKLTLVILATLPVSAVFLSLATKRLDPAIQAQRHDLAKASKNATASITAIDLVKVFGGHDHELWKYFQSIQEAAKHYLIQAQCISIQMGFIGFWVLAIFVVSFWYGLVLVDQGLSPGSVLTTFYATLASFQGIESLMPHWLVLSKGMSAGAFLKAVTTSSKGGRKLRRMGRTVRPKTCTGDIELTDVSFAYPSNPARKVLNKSSLFFPAGETTFIVGKSGSGKSTIGNLIANFYQPVTGDVWVDGESMRVLDEQWVRENITLIQQSGVLFNETFFKNVAFGHRHPDLATREDVIAACDATMLQSTLAKLPQGLDTNVGLQGHNLSGGQKQRLALARARLRNPAVLILDEVTSGLDQVSRSLVMDSICQWRRNKTTIIITHDVSQIGDEDFVYVMNNSFIVEEGFKRDLLKDKEGYLALLAAPDTGEHNPDYPEINIIAPDTPDTPMVQLRSARMANLIVGELESNGLHPTSPGLLGRTSLKAGGSYALRLKLDNVCDSPTKPARAPSFLEDGCKDWDEEKKRFSRYVTQRFSLSEEQLPFEHDDESVDHVFGASHRRNNIPSLRIKPLAKKSSPSGEDIPFPQIRELREKKNSVVTTLRTVWPTIGNRDRITLLLGIIVCMIGAASTPAFSYFFAQLLGVMTSPGDKVERGGKWAGIILGIAVVDGLACGGSRYMLERVGQSWVNAIRTEALRRILLQPKPWFGMSKNSPGRISECLDRNAEEMRNIVGKFIPIMVAVTTMISISVVWALSVSCKLTLVALAPLPVVLGAVKGFAVVSGKWETKCNKSAEDTSAALTEIFLNIRVVRALTLDKYFTKRYEGLVASTLSVGLRRAGFTCGLYGLYQSMGYVLTSLVFYYGTVLLADKKELSFSEVMQVVNLLLFSIGTSADILSSIPQLTMAQATAVQMLDYASMPTQLPEGQQGQTKLESPLPVKMSYLQFSYGKRANTQALRGATLEIRPGSCTAIVGNSGSGKSTVVSILMGLLVPQDPSFLTYGHIPSSQVDMQHLRPQMAYVSQSPFLFPDTIANNITYGLPNDSPYRQDNNIPQAAEAAGLHEWIVSLPEGYGTLVGDGGQSLSGGQAQRLSIARALVRKPRLLVLDEPTSSLDAESADIIRQTIHGLKSRGGDTAVVLVTHSREMMKVADWIVVLGEGGVTVEEGAYNELWEKRGHFARLVSGGEWMEDETPTV